MTKKTSEKSHEKARCTNCFSANVYGMSRVVGYYSIIENWNDSKQAELKDRQRGVYKLKEEPEIKVAPELTTSTPQKIDAKVH
ncbi:hypothetical protein GOV08_03915 [Candidatus Woesearchaeota archaeon]|nr:hypothetical protein [Candidatus Woesearchaeota archaeon]